MPVFLSDFSISLDLIFQSLLIYTETLTGRPPSTFLYSLSGTENWSNLPLLPKKGNLKIHPSSCYLALWTLQGRGLALTLIRRVHQALSCQCEVKDRCSRSDPKKPFQKICKASTFPPNLLSQLNLTPLM